MDVGFKVNGQLCGKIFLKHRSLRWFRLIEVLGGECRLFSFIDFEVICSVQWKTTFNGGISRSN